MRNQFLPLELSVETCCEIELKHNIKFTLLWIACDLSKEKNMFCSTMILSLKENIICRMWNSESAWRKFKWNMTVIWYLYLHSPIHWYSKSQSLYLLMEMLLCPFWSKFTLLLWECCVQILVFGALTDFAVVFLLCEDRAQLVMLEITWLLTFSRFLRCSLNLKLQFSFF